MASSGLQLVGFILGVLSWIGMIATCASPEWRKNSQGQTVIDTAMRYEGLWRQCESLPTGQTRCSVYNQFFIGLPGVLQVCRALMIASIALGFVAIILTILGIKCTSIGNSNPRAKARASIIGGCLFLVAAVLAGASVSYYAHGVVQEYYNPAFNDNVPMHLRMEYGSALFIGWAVLVVGILGGIILAFTSNHARVGSMRLKAIGSDWVTTLWDPQWRQVDKRWAVLVVGILGGIILAFTSIFVLMRLNTVERRGRLIPGTRLKEHRQHQGTQQKQQHLPMTHHHRNTHAWMHAGAQAPEGGSGLTKHHIAQHNSKLATIKNGRSHQHVVQPNNTTSTNHEHKPTLGAEASKSSGEHRRWSDENPSKKQSVDQPDTARLHHHHHMHASKSEGQIKSRSRGEESRDTRDHQHDDDETNGGYARRRPAKEYV